MRITRYTDYSLRVLMYLSIKGETLSNIAEFAASYDIYRKHLMKVVKELNSKGYLIATRGKNGGLRLNGKPEDSNVGALVRETEHELELVECFGSNIQCVITLVCQLRRALAVALDAIFAKLDEYTLADLLPQEKAAEMVQLLRIVSN